MTIDTSNLDAGTDKAKPARTALLAMADELNVISSTAGSSAVGHNPAATPTAGSTGEYLRRAAQLGFAVDLVPMLHLRQFSTRTTSAGGGAVPGALTIGAGVITALATGTGGSNWVAPRVLVVGDGTGASITATVAAGVITGYTVVAGGTGYTAPNTQVFVVDGPVVVLVGDSISTEAPNPSNPGQTMWDVLTKTIREENPDKTISFFNRAVGSQTWTTFNTTANSNYPAWYSNTSKLWTDYIKELQPDLVVVAFGMNDRQNFTPATLRASLATLLAFDTVPDLVLCTPLVPHAGTADPNLSSTDSQEGRDQVAGYIRGHAWRNGLGMLDFNRQCRLVRDGKDVRASALKVVLSSSTQALPFTSGTSGPDYAIEATFTGLTAGFWTGRQINSLLARKGVNVHQFVRVEDAAGKLKVSIIELSLAGPTETVHDTLTTPYTTPTSGSLVLRIQAQDQRVVVSAGGVVIYDRIVARMGGEFATELSVVPANVASLSLSTWVGEPVRFNPRLNDLEIYGGPADVYRGNAQNHPSALGVAYIMQPVLEAAVWAADGMTMGEIPSTANLFGVGVARPLAKWHIAQRRLSVPTVPTAGGSGLVVEDTLNPGHSYLSETTGVARTVYGDTADANRAQMFYNHNNDEWGVQIAGTNQLRTSVSGGVLLGAPTGGYKGVGTLNMAGDVYKNNTAYTNPDYVFELEYYGQLHRFAKNPGAKHYQQRGGRMSLKELRDYTKTHLRLPGINGKAAGMFRRSDWTLQTLEEHALYLMDLGERLEALHERLDTFDKAQGNG